MNDAKRPLTYPVTSVNLTSVEIDRFWSHVSILEPEECWLWKLSTTVTGYGQFRVSGTPRLSHRIAWVLTNGQIPDGIFVCHRCDTPPCCNPKHLFLGTQADNMRDCKEKKRTASGDRNGSKTHPECIPRGDKSFSRMHPERLKRGSLLKVSKLNEKKVASIRQLFSDGKDVHILAEMFGVDWSNIYKIVRRDTWRHVP